MNLVRRALEAARRSDGELFLFLEDDLLFNRFIRQNLLAWEPIRAFRRGEHFFASIFDPGVSVSRLDAKARWAEVEPNSAYGAQGLVISKRTVEHLVTCWGAVRSIHADTKLPRLAGFVCPILYHRPSLVQHVGFDSLWGGPYLSADDFDPGWVATE
jgi:hypothetical protein